MGVLGQTRYSRLPQLQLTKSQSSGMMDVLEDLLGTAQNELDHTSHAESNGKDNFAMLRQSLGPADTGQRDVGEGNDGPG